MFQKMLQGGGGNSQIDTAVMIYDCGKENTDIGIFDNIFAENNLTPQITKTSNGIVFGHTNYWKGINLNKVIDLTEYSALYFEVEVGTLGRIQIGLANKTDITDWSDYDNSRIGFVISTNEAGALNNIAVTANSKNIITMNLKDTISNGSIVLAQVKGNMTIKRVYAIKK